MAGPETDNLLCVALDEVENTGPQINVQCNAVVVFKACPLLSVLESYKENK